MAPFYHQPSSGERRSDYQASNQSPSFRQCVRESTNTFHDGANSVEGMAPPQQPSLPNHDAYDDYAVQQQQQYYAPLLEQFTPPWQQHSHLGGQSDGNAYISDWTQVQSMKPGGINRHGSSHQYPWQGTPDSFSSSAGYPQQNAMGVGNIHPNPTQDSHAPEYPYRIYSTDESLVRSPGQTSSAAHSPASLPYQSDLSAQATRYNNQSNDYFDPYAGYSQYVSGHGQPQVESAVQSPGLYFNQETGSPSFASPTPDQSTQHNEEHDTAASYPSLGYVCLACNASFGRQTDYDRHMKTAKKHNDPKGPTCPLYGEDGCRFETPFTRPDNFKPHYMRRHRRSSLEAREVIQDWKRSLKG